MQVSNEKKSKISYHNTRQIKQPSVQMTRSIPEHPIRGNYDPYSKQDLHLV